MNGILNVLEQFLEVHDITKLLALLLVVGAIHATNGLEQVLSLHFLVKVEIGCRRRIETSEQLVHHNQQFHRAWVIDKLFLCPCLKLLGGLVAKHDFRLGCLIFSLALGFA